jgi:hypothetical protein
MIYEKNEGGGQGPPPSPILQILAEPTPGRAWAADPAQFLGEKMGYRLASSCPAARTNNDLIPSQPCLQRPRSLPHAPPAAMPRSRVSNRRPWPIAVGRPFPTAGLGPSAARSRLPPSAACPRPPPRTTALQHSALCSARPGCCLRWTPPTRLTWLPGLKKRRQQKKKHARGHA